MEIKSLAVGDEALVAAASHLFDGPALMSATTRLLSEDGHHLLTAYEGEDAVGFISGVEVTHPDKGTEMFIYELEVDEAFRRRGVASALIDRLRLVAVDRGCYGMWVLTGEENAAALATYIGARGSAEPGQVVVTWDFSTSTPGDD